MITFIHPSVCYRHGSLIDEIKIEFLNFLSITHTMSEFLNKTKQRPSKERRRRRRRR